MRPPTNNDSAAAIAWRNISEDGTALACLVFLLLGAALCFCAPLAAPYSYEEQNLALGSVPPSLSHIFGTDMLGRDILSRILYGGRISFAVGLLATGVAVFIGVAYGMVSGMAGGKIDALMMRFVDIVYSLPFTIFVILLMIAFGRSIWLIFVAIGAVEWLTMARIVRGITARLEVSAICRGVGRAGTVENQDYDPTYFAERAQFYFSLRHLDSSQRYAARSLSQLSWSRRAGAPAVVGQPRKGRRRIYGRRPVDARFSRVLFQRNTLRAKQGRRSAVGKENQMKRIAIIGGGAAGLFCAASLSREFDVTVFESSDATLKKVCLTGGGRCNFTNEKIDTGAISPISIREAREICASPCAISARKARRIFSSLSA